MRKKFIGDPVQFEFDELERFSRYMENLEPEMKGHAREGVCDECGAYGVVSKYGGTLLCGSCRTRLNKKKKRK